MMPELPEVETIRRSLCPHLIGQTICQADFARFDILRSRLGSSKVTPAEAARLSTGAVVTGLDRWGKYLLMQLDGTWGWAIHFGMSGTFRLKSTEEIDAHTHVRFLLSSGDWLSFRDPRRFGSWTRIDRADLVEAVNGWVGLDLLAPALDWTRFRALLSKSESPIKSRLLDQRFISGLGNIYVDEALHAAGIAPFRPSRTLTDDEWRALFRAAQRVVRAGIHHRGTTLSDYNDVNGNVGDHSSYLRVYGRAGQRCPKCRTVIEKVKFRGRGTHFCPACQSANGR